MQKWLVVLSLSMMALSAEENHVKPYNDIASLEGGMQTIVDGKVSVISREPVFIETDLVIPAIHPIQIHRSYQRPSHKWDRKDPFWHTNYFGNGKYSEDRYSYRQSFYCTDENGTYLESYTDKNKYGNWVPLTNSYYYGETNIARGAISGKSNLKNYRISFQQNGNGMAVKSAGGCIKRYAQRKKGEQVGLPYEGDHLALVDIHYPNGFATHVSFLSATELNVATHDANGQQMCHVIYAGLANQLFKTLESPFYFLYADDGRHVRYDFERKYSKPQWYGLLKKVSGPTIPTIEYTYDAAPKDEVEHLIRRTDSEGGYCEFDYYAKDKKYSMEGIHWDKENWTPMNIDTRKDSWYNHGVKAIKAPSGTDGTQVSTHRFIYPNETRTDVYDYFNYLTTYHSDNRYRPIKIVYYEQPQSTQYIDLVDESHWGQPDKAQETFLQTRYLYDGKNPFQYRGKHYVYDKFGNPEKEHTFGNLTGGGGMRPTVGKHGKIDLTYVEHHTKTSTFDALHNIKTERYPNGLTVTYDYDEGTDRLRSKTFENLSVTRFRYNEAGALIEESESDGKDYKRIRRHTPRMAHPCFGFPEVTEEYYVDSDGTEVLLTSQQFEYHRNGQLKKRATFDVVEKWDDLDAYDRCTTEVTKTGETIKRIYDTLGNILEEVGPHPDFKKEFRYDKMHRLFYKTETFQGKTKTYSYQYDEMSRPKTSTDPYFQTTRFVPDRYGRILETHYPDGSVEKSRYDAFNNEVSKTDKRGFTTQTAYTSYDKPYYIEYPDKSSESFSYDLSGNLTRYTSKSGQVTTYHYDIYHRLLKKAEQTESGIAEEITTYNGKLIDTITDASGHVRTFTYDGAGRKTSETYGGCTTRFEYDSFGRLYKTLYSEGSRVELFDAGDRVEESWLEDPDGTLHGMKRLHYDPFGNVCLEVEGDRVTTYTYDAWGRLLSRTDPKGYSTTWVYEESTHLVRREIDGETGYQTVETFDVMGRVAKAERLDFLGTVLQTIEYLYDRAGNKTDEIHGEKRIHWEYDSMGKVRLESEAYESDLSRTTTMHYNTRGEKEWEQKPDGNKIEYTYYLNGLVKEVKARDCNYFYTYDRLGRMEKVEDRIYGLNVERSYYPAGAIHQECYNNFVFNYVYDSLDRPTLITLPDQTKVRYTYNIATMTSVERGGRSHTYTRFDPYGNVLEETLIDGTTRTRTYDILGQLTSISHPHFSLRDIGYDRWGSIKERTIDGHQETYDYDGLHQLTRENGTTYAYDSLYNRTQKDDLSYELNLLDQVLSAGTETFSYDLNGNLKERTANGHTTTYSYDGLDRLIRIDRAGSTTEYRYDGLNRRLLKLGREKEEYWYLDNNEIGSVVKGSVRSLRTLGLGQGAEIGAAVCLELSGLPYTPHHDQVGNLVAIHSDLWSERYHYTSFGEQQGQRLSPWRYASKRLDPETGFIYFGRRYYAPSLGKFITKDPSGFTDGANLYAYVHNRPLTHFDLYGCLDFLEGFYLGSGILGGIGIQGIDAITYPYRLMTTPSLYTRYTCDNYAEVLHIEGRVPSDHLVTSINGWDCNRDDAIAFAQQSSKMSGGASVDHIYNGSFETFGNMHRWGAERFGNHYTQSAEQLANKWINFFENCSPSGYVVHYLHSEGAYPTDKAVNLIPHEYRQRIKFCAIAPAKYLDKDLNVRYIVGSHDIVHLTDIFGYFGNWNKITTVPSNAYWFRNAHSYSNIEFENIGKRVYKEFTQ